MKNEGVCAGCKYVAYPATSHSCFKSVCNYSADKGQSRLVVERQNGGYKTDSCVCYEPKKKRRKNKFNAK